MNNILNIRENPFVQKNAEDEMGILSHIYYKPVYYDELLDNAIGGVSRMLVGQRGLGKSATILMLFEEVKAKKTMPLLITRYDKIPLSNNENYFLYRMMQAMCFGISKHLFVHDSDRKKLNKTQKDKLNLYIQWFYDPLTSEEYIKCAKEIKAKQRWNIFRRLYNKALPLINGLINGAVQISSDTIRRVIGIEGADLEAIAKEYLKEADLERVNTLTMEEIVSWDKNTLVTILRQMKDIASTIGYNSVVVLFDKIDEYASINADVDKIVDFIKDILLDTDLLYTENLSIIFSIWSDAKHALGKAGFRYDKFEDVNIEWHDYELEELIDKRLSYYTIDKSRPVTLKSLLPNDSDRKDVLTLAGNSPRSLIKLLGHLYSMESGQGGINAFRPETLSRGLVQFCEHFDYQSMQSVKSVGKHDIYDWINRLLQMKRHAFTAEDIRKEFSLATKGHITYISTFTKYGFIRESIRPSDDGKPVYEVIEPRLRYLISRGILEIK